MLTSTVCNHHSLPRLEFTRMWGDWGRASLLPAQLAAGEGSSTGCQTPPKQLRDHRGGKPPPVVGWAFPGLPASLLCCQLALIRSASSSCQPCILGGGGKGRHPPCTSQPGVSSPLAEILQGKKKSHQRARKRRQSQYY